MSNSKKKGWKEYESRTWLFVPKLFKSGAVTLLFYAVLYMAAKKVYNNGGIEASVLLLTQ